MLENCRLVLYVSRIYGCHPHTIIERPGPKYFGLLVSYSLIASVSFFMAGYFSDSLTSCNPVGAMVVGCTLQHIYRYSRCTYMILTPLLAYLRHAEFEKAVAAANEFDRLIDWHSENTRVNRRTQIIVLFFCHFAWFLTTSFGWYFSNGFSWETQILLFVERTAFTTEVAKLCYLYDALRRRFKRLNELCEELSNEASPMNSQQVVYSLFRRYSEQPLLDGRLRRVTVGVNAGRLTISKIQRMHSCLRQATYHLNFYFGPQLFCWITCMTIDILVFIFFIIYNTNRAMMIFLQVVFLVYLSLIIFTIGRICHLTCDQANALANTIFSVEAFVLRRSEFSVEAIELGVYLQTHPLRITVLNIFIMDSRFSLTIFSLVLMYVITSSSIH